MLIVTLPQQRQLFNCIRRRSNIKLIAYHCLTSFAHEYTRNRKERAKKRQCTSDYTFSTNQKKERLLRHYKLSSSNLPSLTTQCNLQKWRSRGKLKYNNNITFFHIHMIFDYQEQQKHLSPRKLKRWRKQGNLFTWATWPETEQDDKTSFRPWASFAHVSPLILQVYCCATTEKHRTTKF